MVKRDRRLTLGQVLEARRQVERGAKVGEVARAFGVSVRSIYRALEGQLERVSIDGAEYVYHVREGRPPVLIGRALEAPA
jgi:predicted DNA-binding transcriptional regulator YafY